MQVRSPWTRRANEPSSSFAREQYWDTWEFDQNKSQQDEEEEEEEEEKEEEEPRDSLSPLDNVYTEREKALATLQRPCSGGQHNAATRPPALFTPSVGREPAPSVATRSRRSIKRMSRPPSLNLQGSNAAVQEHSPLLPQTAPGCHNYTSPTDDPTVVPRYSPLSEGLVSTSIVELPIMGASGSKGTSSSDNSKPPTRRKHTVFRRQSKSLPPRPPTFTFPPSESAATSTQNVSNHVQTVSQQPTQESHESSNPTSVGQEPESHQPSIQTLPSTPPYDEEEKPGTDEQRLETPMLRLPTPSLVPEESPGKYGMDTESTPLRNEQFVPRPRPKSGTGAQIFQDACALQSNTAYLRHLSQSEGESSRSPGASRKFSSLTSLPTTTASLASDITTHPRFASTYTLPPSPSLPAPAPPLTPMQVDCLHAHRTLHRSKNSNAPVACMLCENADLEQRWRCHWCCLRICTGCKEKLEGIDGRDIAKLLRRLVGEEENRRSEAASSPEGKDNPEMDVD
ncbi:MAG: hypothetical protein M1821_007372 [Bathelium mastoideum]|nr:MAG: hypothetical protein M1821_007372 [Bathelium mastoideum]